MYIAVESLLTRPCLCFHDLSGNLYVNVVTILVYAHLSSRVLFHKFVVLPRRDPVHGYLRLFRPATKKQIETEQKFNQDLLHTIRRHGLQMRFTVGGSSPDSTSSTAASTLGRTWEEVFRFRRLQLNLWCASLHQLQNVVLTFLCLE